MPRIPYWAGFFILGFGGDIPIFYTWGKRRALEGGETNSINTYNYS